MEMTVRDILQTLQTLIKDKNYTAYEFSIAKKKGKMGLSQKHAIHLKYLQGRIHDLSNKLEKKLKGIITTVKYSFTNQYGTLTKVEQEFVNLSEQEIRDILEVQSIIHKLDNITILEIKEIPTGFRYI